MPTKIPKLQRTLKQKDRPFRLFRNSTVGVFSLLIISYLGVSIYNGIVIPTLVANTIKKNVDTINVVSVYTKEFETDILAALSQQSLSQPTQSHITSQIDILSSKVVQSKNTLVKGNFDDTKEFYDTIYTSLDSFESLLTTTRAYLSYQFCFLKGQSDIAKTKDLQKDLFTQLESLQSLDEKPELYNQLSDIFELQYAIYNTLNTCSDGQYSYLKTSDWDIYISTYTNYAKDQSNLLQNAALSAQKKNTSDIEKIFSRLADNDKTFVDLFSTDYFTILKFQPLENIGDANKSLLAQYSVVEDNLTTIKSKYKLT